MERPSIRARSRFEMAVASTDQISAGSQVASVLAPLRHFVRLSFRHSPSDFVQSHSIKGVGSNLPAPPKSDLANLCGPKWVRA